MLKITIPKRLKKFTTRFKVSIIRGNSTLIVAFYLSFHSGLSEALASLKSALKGKIETQKTFVNNIKNEMIVPLKEMTKRHSNDTSLYGKDYKKLEKDYKTALESLEKVI